MLQSRERVTAAEVAAELEVSERTARRDLEALSMAGIPVYPQPGRGGGWALLGGARPDLSGLRGEEVRALFTVAGPAAAATPELKAALRKLIRALPEPFRAGAQTAASSVVIDAAGWARCAACSRLRTSTRCRPLSPTVCRCGSTTRTARVARRAGSCTRWASP